MTYEEHEFSYYNGRPIELYKFVGTYQTYLYTSKEIDHIQTVPPDGDFTYNAIPIRRGAMKVGTQDDDKIDLGIQLPSTSQLALDYGFQVTPPDLELIVYRIHRDSDELIVYWRGTVTNVTINGDIATLQTPSILASALDGSCPSAWYQTPCNFRLFDPQTCQVSREDNSVVTLAMTVEGLDIWIDDVGGFPDDFFKGGEILSTESGERRMILSHVGQHLTITFPFAELVVGAPIEVTAGCDHAWGGDCLTKFNNQLRHGGYNFVPPDNPFVSGIE